MTSLSDPEWKDACAHIGELVLIYTALDYQLTDVTIDVMQLDPAPMLQCIVATVDTRQRLEMLKARGKIIMHSSWRKGILDYVEKFEKIARVRNAACHTAVLRDPTSQRFEFAPNQAAKLLKSMKLVGRGFTVERVSLAAVQEAIALAEGALGLGMSLLHNFKKVNATLKATKDG